MKQLSMRDTALVVALSLALSFALVTLTAHSASTISTNISTGGTITATGRIHATGTLVVTGAISTYGAININEDAANSDFRIESQNISDLVFVDASADRVGIASTTPARKFSVDGDAIVTGSVKVGALTATGTTIFNQTSADVDLRVSGDNVTNLVFVDASTDRVGIATTTPARRFSAEGDAIITGTLKVGLLRSTSTIGIATTTPTQEFGVDGDAFFSSDATTTIEIHTRVGAGDSTGKGSCIEMYTAAGVVYRTFVAKGGTLTTQAGTCK